MFSALAPGEFVARLELDCDPRAKELAGRVGKDKNVHVTIELIEVLTLLLELLLEDLEPVVRLYVWLACLLLALTPSSTGPSGWVGECELHTSQAPSASQTYSLAMFPA
jgi:hypothetical protein